MFQVVGIYNDDNKSNNSPAYIPFSVAQLLYNKGYGLSSFTFTVNGLVSEEANEAFNAIYLQRSAAERDRAFAADMKTLRPATDEAFDSLAYAINALFAVNEMVTNDEGKRTALTKVIDDVNAIVVRFRKTIGQKSPSGSSSTDEPADEPGGETPEPGGGEETDSPSVI